MYLCVGLCSFCGNLSVCPVVLCVFVSVSLCDGGFCLCQGVFYCVSGCVFRCICVCVCYTSVCKSICLAMLEAISEGISVFVFLCVFVYS